MSCVVQSLHFGFSHAESTVAKKRMLFCSGSGGHFTRTDAAADMSFFRLLAALAKAGARQADCRDWYSNRRPAVVVW